MLTEHHLPKRASPKNLDDFKFLEGFCFLAVLRFEDQFRLRFIEVFLLHRYNSYLD
jgi:hypothetical protein